MNSAGQLSSALDAFQVALAMDGDRAAFTLLYKRWHPKLLRFAYRLTQDADDASDVMQEAAMAIARNIHRLDDATLFGPWAYTIVRRRAADHIKSASRARRAQASANDVPRPIPPDNDAHIALTQALSRLDERDRTLLSLFYLDDMTGPELAAAMGVPLGTLKSRLFDARQHLKQVYDTPPDGASND